MKSTYKRHSALEISKRIILSVTSAVLVLWYPTTALALDDMSAQSSDTVAVAQPTPTPSSAPFPEPTVLPTPTPRETIAPTPAPIIESNHKNESSQTGPTSPTGEAASTYSFNKDTGLWENAYYTWDPATNQTKPKNPLNYSFNPTTGHWDTTKWVYDAASESYVPNKVEVPTSSVPLDVLAEQKPLTPTSTSQNTTDMHSTNTGLFDLFFNAAISNTINSTSVSGDAIVSKNTLAGGATSGDASAIATIINQLQSAWSPLNGIATFNANIKGDVVGDLVIAPPQANQQLSVDPSSSNLLLNSQQNGLIDNNVNLVASSGNASVAQNTEAGSATTGSASAVAQIINMIGSVISSGKSFIGSINIYGTLDGDILFPPGVLNTLLASNASVQVPTKVLESSTNSTSVTTSNNQTINNNTQLAAQSGTATVDGNTTAGSAKTGTATTKVTLLNLTGNQVIAKNALLVFVNVMGKWVGLIMNAPSGATSAMVGGGVSANNQLTGNADINSASTNTINNNVNVLAESGDASVTKNTKAGDAVTGNAGAGVNIFNMINSDLSLSDWFGVLFINVFGTWKGSFGVDTAAGSTQSSAIASAATDPNPVLSFVPKNNSAKKNYMGVNPIEVAPIDPVTPMNNVAQINPIVSNADPSSAQPSKVYNWNGLIIALCVLAALSTLGYIASGRIEDRGNVTV